MVRGWIFSTLRGSGDCEALDLESSITINRPVADVFAYVANFENHPRWERNFQQVRRLFMTDDGIGTTYECVFKFPGQRVTATPQIW